MMSSTMMSGLLSRPVLEAWGERIGDAAVGAAGLPLVLGLRGPLGAGKSVLARAVARGAGVTGPMPSPTYNLLFSYAGRDGLAVHHLDLYRLDDPDEVWELGWEELAVGAQVVLIEWPERAGSLLPPDRWDVVLEFTDDGAAADAPPAAGARREPGAEPDAGPDAGPGAEPDAGPDAASDAGGVRRVTVFRRGEAPSLPELPGGAS